MNKIKKSCKKETETIKNSTDESQSDQAAPKPEGKTEIAIISSKKEKRKTAFFVLLGVLILGGLVLFAVIHTGIREKGQTMPALTESRPNTGATKQKNVGSGVQPPARDSGTLKSREDSVKKGSIKSSSKATENENVNSTEIPEGIDSIPPEKTEQTTVAAGQKTGEDKVATASVPAKEFSDNTQTEATNVPACTPSKAPAAGHTHNWVPQTQIVHHEAETRQVYIIDQTAWDEPVYEEQPVYKTQSYTVCNVCGEDITGNVQDHSEVHMDWDTFMNPFSYRIEYRQMQVGTQIVQTGSIRHEEVGHYETQIVKAAYDETVTVGYQCSDCYPCK